MLTDFGSYNFTNYLIKKKYNNLHMKSILFCLYFLSSFLFFKTYAILKPSALPRFCCKSSEIFREGPGRIVINP